MKHNSIFKNHNDLFQAKASKKRQKGQGMTEYLAATALIGVASIAVLGFMGDTLQTQFAAMTNEIAGETGVGNQTAAKDIAAGSTTQAAIHKTLQNFQGQNAVTKDAASTAYGAGGTTTP